MIITCWENLLVTGLSYSDAGVNIDKGNELISRIAPLLATTTRTGADCDIKGFGGVFDLGACKFNDPVLVSASDGVGTKLLIATESNRHENIGIDLVAMCVNDLLVHGAEPLFFLDYYSCGSLNENIASTVIGGIVAGCREAGVALIGGETAEMPGLYEKHHYDLAGFSVGAVERNHILPLNNITKGDIILGLVSNGIHSNGYSLVRRIVEISKLNWSDSAPFDSEIPLASALLKPTRIYVKTLLPIIRTQKIKALAHITGGGLTENLPRVIPEHLSAEINLTSFPIPKIFRWLADCGQVSQNEMLRTFNCGIGMCVICTEQESHSIIESLSVTDENAYIIGRITTRNKDPVTYLGELQSEND